MLCSDAIKHLVSEDAIKHSSAELSYIVTWALGTPSIALSYFSRLVYKTLIDGNVLLLHWSVDPNL